MGRLHINDFFSWGKHNGLAYDSYNQSKLIKGCRALQVYVVHPHESRTVKDAALDPRQVVGG